ncbi:hypothetical protein KCU78_g8740, partial [Aureobasidium melanogenum]
MIITLEVTQYLSIKNQGLATTTQRIHYLWTYGPTAVFSILAIFWGALEYQTKVMMPWKLMTDEPQTAKDSLLLDYVSPNPVIVLWKSLRAKHWPVVVTVLGSQLIILVTVISTGIFVLEPTLVQRKETPMAVRKFNNSNLNITIVNALPVLAVSGIMSGNISVAYPAYTNQFSAIEPFTPIREAAGVEVSKSADVNVLSADLDCHVGHVANATMRVLITGWDLKASLSNSNCTTDLNAIGTRFDDSSDHNVNPAAQRVGAATIQRCSQGEDTDTGYLVLTFAQASPPKDLEFGNKGGQIMLPMGSFELNATVLFCQPTNKLEKALVTTDSSNSILEVINGNVSAHLGVSSWDMALAFNSSILDAAKSMSRTGDMYAYDTFFRILQAISLQDPAKYMDAQVLEAESRRLFAAFWAQIANQHLLMKKHQGLRNVTMKGYVHYTWTVVPAAILTTIKLLGQSLAFSIEALDPYLVLKAGAGTARQTLFHDYLSQTSLFRCFSSTRFSRWAVLSVSMCTLFSPFLTIVVSGLFDEQRVPRFQTLNTHAVDQLTNFAARSYRGDDRPATLDCSLDVWEQATLDAANLLVQQVVPYPEGTVDNYIYPNVTGLSSNKTMSKSFNASFSSIITPGYRPRTVCEAMDPSAFQYTFRNDGSNDGGDSWRVNEPDLFYLNFTHPDLTGCDCFSPQYHTEYEYCTPSLLSLGFTINSNNTLFSETLDVGLDLSSVGWTSPQGWPNPSVLALSDRQCPNLTLIYGDWDTQSNSSLNISGVACYYNMEETQLNISYALPQRTVTQITPSKTSLVHGDPSCWPFMDESINDYLANSASGPYDSLFMAALNGSDPQTFFAPSNAATLASRVSQIYDTFLTQYFSYNLRNANFTTGVPQVLETLVDTSRQRLFQNRTSTSILEGLLGIIWVCTVIALVLFDSKELLPKDPCSIAAQASLFADSEFIDLIPPGAECLSDKELAETTPFKDHLFSLGWWEKEGEAEKTFGIDVGQAISVGQDDMRWSRIKRFFGL